METHTYLPPFCAFILLFSLYTFIFFFFAQFVGPVKPMKHASCAIPVLVNPIMKDTMLPFIMRKPEVVVIAVIPMVRLRYVTCLLLYT